MNHFQLVKQRYSVRAYKPDPVEDEKLQEILECARWAPTAHNRQAIKIIVVKTAGLSDSLGKIFIQNFIARAPYLICVCSITGQSFVRRDGKSYGDVDAAIIMDHIIMAATSLGLGTCWIASFDRRAARDILKLQDSWEPVIFSPLGYPADAPAARHRKPLDELVVYRDRTNLEMGRSGSSSPPSTSRKGSSWFGIRPR